MAEFENTRITPDEEEFLKAIEADSEKDYLKGIKKKNKKFLLSGVGIVERERIACWINQQLSDSKGQHDTISDNIDEYDDVYRMERKEIIGSDGSLPNHRSPLSTVTLDVIHATIMNVFFSPKNIARALPVEEGDVDKVNKLDTFMNWSAKNELQAFENLDRLFHCSTKNGECPYIVHWVKEYGTEVKRKAIPDPTNPAKPLIDPDTQKPLFQEVEEAKLLYNGPRLEIFSRKDYFQPKNAVMGKTPEWEARRIRLTYDQYLRDELQGKMFPGSSKDIKGWGSSDSDTNLDDYEGDTIPTGEFEKEFIEFYGRMRINTIKENDIDDTIEIEELEDEFIAIIEPDSEVLCQLRFNRFPLKRRPIGVDYFIPDSEGRRAGIGVMKQMNNLQTAYDVLYNQFIDGASKSNNPIIFVDPRTNLRKEKIKIQSGFMYTGFDPSNVKIFEFPQPNQSLRDMLGLIDKWSQLMFGISDYAAGVESTIDPDAPAKKVEAMIQRGNVRQNVIIKRKNKTIQDILERWFLLYKDNMPENKFARITGDQDQTFKFMSVTLADFALNGIPDFELTGNILNANKSLEINKTIAIYQLLMGNPFFNPQTQVGIKALFNLTKWLIDKLDEMGLSSFLPSMPGDQVHTPEEENMRFLQGDSGSPTPEEDHQRHIQVHRAFGEDPNLPEEIQEIIIKHIQEHVQMMISMLTMQTQQGVAGGQPVTGQPGQPVQPQGGVSGIQGQAKGVVQGEPTGVAGR